MHSQLQILLPNKLKAWISMQLLLLLFVWEIYLLCFLGLRKDVSPLIIKLSWNFLIPSVLYESIFHHFNGSLEAVYFIEKKYLAHNSGVSRVWTSYCLNCDEQIMKTGTTCGSQDHTAGQKVKEQFSIQTQGIINTSSHRS